MSRHFSRTELEHVGYRVIYRVNETNHCPGCGQMHWLVGRKSAECAFCGTALPLQNVNFPGLKDTSGMSAAGSHSSGLAAFFSGRSR
ncbi:hypothetical protein [Sphingomonas sp. KC8]|uniref:hypothetical protein n=1 Tax=Sphingomonas sp. KC8 TaxID=1030157 RepID=UPI0002489FD9|nr:hypothetical protein [Sphingomonas sp. KC8]ARS27882.1 hypothetical protein KC8_11365 [Sphingomonas sp. KC8]